MNSRDFDVIIIGGGGAGICAAMEALNAGASVLVCEAAPRIGGSTATAGGVIIAGGTEIQKARGIDDSIDAFFNDYMAANRYQVEPALARRLCEGGVEAIAWLKTFGITFNPANLFVTAVENPKTPRGHQVDGYGLGMMTALEQAATANGLEVALNTRVQRLLLDGNGAVHGIHADGADVHAPAVIIATGGFGNNFDLLERYYRDAARHGRSRHFYIGINEHRGDGLLMGEAAGAAIVGSGCGQALIAPAFSREAEPYFPGWLVYVNREGFRFINETTAYVMMDIAVNNQTDAVCFALMDHAAFARADNDPRYKTGEFLMFPMGNWMPDALAAHLASGKIIKGDTLRELGHAAGIAPEALSATIAAYNDDAVHGRDSRYFKSAPNLIPLATPPFYAIELRASAVGTTHTGLKTDIEARVIGRNGQPIDGLYCAGECAGGITARGNSILSCLVFGRIAGKSAAVFAKSECRDSLRSSQPTSISNSS